MNTKSNQVFLEKSLSKNINRFRYLTLDELKLNDEKIADYAITKSFIYNGKKIITNGDLMNLALANSMDFLESIEDLMHDIDYLYIRQWLRTRLDYENIEKK